MNKKYKDVCDYIKVFVKPQEASKELIKRLDSLINSVKEDDIKIVKKYRNESEPEIDRIVKNIIIELAISHKERIEWVKVQVKKKNHQEPNK